MLDALQEHRGTHEVCQVQLDQCPETACLAAEAESGEARLSEPAEAQSEDPQHADRFLAVIKKLHVNLGHPSVHDLVRILRHSKASEAAIKAAQSFECTVCKNSKQPASALPGSPVESRSST